MDRELKYALGKTVPIMFSYLFLSMAFGIMMNQAGCSVTSYCLICL